jgi:hypothetical protein
MMKPILLKVINVVAGIAAVVFWFMPLGTVTQVLLCVGSLAIAFVCLLRCVRFFERREYRLLAKQF